VNIWVRIWHDTPTAGRRAIIDLACDADYQQLAGGAGHSARLTIAQALEVLDD
jgi:hypothetical protein